MFPPGRSPSSPTLLRILHATDLHCFVPASWRQILTQPKRIIGATNWYLLRRAKRFDEEVQKQLVNKMIELKPDVVILSGDLTNLSTSEEFHHAYQILRPILHNNGLFPTFIIPGNHDAYTPDAVIDDRGAPTSPFDSGTRGIPAASLMRSVFGPWMESMSEEDRSEWSQRMGENGDDVRRQLERQQQHFMKFSPDSIPKDLYAHTTKTNKPTPLPYLPIFGFDFLRIIGLNPCRPTRIASKGEYHQKQLSMLSHLLRTNPTPSATGEFSSWHRNDLVSQIERRKQSTQPIHQQAHSHNLASLDPSNPSDFDSTYNLMVGHYPVLDGSGRPYESAHPYHGVENGAKLRQILTNDGVTSSDGLNRFIPNMFLHGHVHRGFQDQLTCNFPSFGEANSTTAESRDSTLTESFTRPRRREMFIFNSGSSGQSFSHKSKRCAAFNLYTIAKHDNNTPSNESTSTASTLQPRRSYPHAAPPLPLSPSSVDPSARSPSLLDLFDLDPPSSRPPSYWNPNGSRRSLHSIYHQTNTPNISYSTYIQRWLHDGQQFQIEPFPYTSGF